VTPGERGDDDVRHAEADLRAEAVNGRGAPGCAPGLSLLRSQCLLATPELGRQGV
jgi:hypothetical protein